MVGSMVSVVEELGELPFEGSSYSHWARFDVFLPCALLGWRPSLLGWRPSMMCSKAATSAKASIFCCRPIGQAVLNLLLQAIALGGNYHGRYGRFTTYTTYL